jgi:ParB/RepB/Spo0J family partition protein
MALVKAKSKKRSKRSEEQHEPPTVERIAVADVEVTGKHREVDPKKVDSVAASIAKIGLRTPVTVRRITKGFGQQVLTLVAGFVRLKAAQAIGLEYIDAFVMQGTETDARMWQLMENLYRADLTALQRAEHVAELVEAVLQDAKGVQSLGGQQPHDRGIKRAAKALGFSRDEVRRSLKIDGISYAAKTKAKELGLDDNQSALLKIAEEDGEQAQLGVLEGIKSGKTSGSKMAAPGKAKSKKKKSLKPPAEDASGPDERDHDRDQDQEEIASPALSPVSNEDADSDLEADTSDDSTEKDRLFAELNAAWDTHQNRYANGSSKKSCIWI